MSTAFLFAVCFCGEKKIIAEKQSKIILFKDQTILFLTPKHLNESMRIQDECCKSDSLELDLFNIS